MKRVCFVTHCLQAGGMERVMLEVVAYFAAREEMEIHLVLYGFNREIFYPVPKNVILHLPPFDFKNSTRFFSTVRTLFFLRKILKELKPASALSFGEYWNSFVLLATLGTGLQVFVSDRSQPDKPLGRMQHQLRRWLYPTAAGVIAQTETAASIYRNIYKPKRMEVIGNPIRKIATTDRPREKEILMVGRLIETKHQDQLITIFAKLNAPEWRLVIVGEDHLKQHHLERLKRLAVSLGVADRVEFAGKRLDVELYYNRASLFAFTSSSEGFPNVIGEALAAGLPVVSYDCVAGPAEMITNGQNGYLIPLFDQKLFGKRLQQLIDNPGLQKDMSDRAIKSVDKFDPLVIGRRFYDFIVPRE
ncbi:glycosyltransferase [uncultured Imperialibacter sp.]|uniref:glycosyltransferase n=1 Tax=uncultured Imperialibacter sp. TaxID=1672639 RepID=UPI0030D94C9F|tara:strand:- start:748 stop:1827 length:1080 start_codon:yes stop_codon:yes gene_type:complete